MNINDIYEHFYQKVNKSLAFSKYCYEVFGIDFTQDGFSDINQIKDMINIVNFTNQDSILEIGCGNGKLADYLSRHLNAHYVGIDYSTSAISFAQKLAEKNKLLQFNIGDINDLDLHNDTYSIILLIDSIYFSNDYEKTLDYLYSKIKKNGKIVIFYSDFIFDPDCQKHKLASNETIIGKIVSSKMWNCKIIDFTSEHFELMKRKNKISIKYKELFIQENNEEIFNKINTESISDNIKEEDFAKFSNRYMFCIEKIEEHPTTASI